MSYSCEQRNKGFSLVEIVLSMTMTSVFLLTLIFFSQNILSSQTKQRTIREVTEQGDLIMDQILTLIHDAEAVTTPTGGGSGSTLDLDYTDGSLDPTEVTLVSGVIGLERNAGGVVPLHNTNITASALTFTDRTQTDAWDTIDIEFTLEYDSASSTQEYTFAKTWYGAAVIREYER